MGYPFYIPGVAGHRPPTAPLDLVTTGGLPRHVIDGGTVHQVQTPLNFERELLTATGFELPEDGTLAEKAAMAFHGPQGAAPFHASYTPDGTPAGFEVNGLGPVAGSPYADPCRSDGTPYYGGALGTQVGNPRVYKASVIELDAQLNKVGWHFNQQRIIVLDQDVDASLSGDRPPEPFVMRANTNACIDFDHTNLVPSVYQMDDYQVKTPTDVIGQHIHLVKFDVMSADGSANGWNYEDGTLSPDETAERIHALEAPGGSWTGSPLGNAGPRTTRQRWYVDPIFDNDGNERGLGNVFTHDHFGPSTHQQGGLYATMLIEPEGSSWRDSETGVMLGSRSDGGPTSWRADIIPADAQESYREFYLEFADFQLAYRDAALLDAVNPPGRAEVGLPFILQRRCPPPFPPQGPCPEAISSEDPGTYVVNMRNEPIATRVNDPGTIKQAAGQAGDLAYAYASNVRRRSADGLGLVRRAHGRSLHTRPAGLRGRQGLDSCPGGRPRGGPQLQHPRHPLAAAVRQPQLGLPQLADDGHLGVLPLRGPLHGLGQGRPRLRGLPVRDGLLGGRALERLLGPDARLCGHPAEPRAPAQQPGRQGQAESGST
jgi:hypothetical protein